jgi:hypothetical protein
MMKDSTFHRIWVFVWSGVALLAALVATAFYVQHEWLYAGVWTAITAIDVVVVVLRYKTMKSAQQTEMYLKQISELRRAFKEARR